MFGRFNVGNASVAVLGVLVLLCIATVDATGEMSGTSKPRPPEETQASLELLNKRSLFWLFPCYSN